MSERLIKKVVLDGNNPYISEHIYIPYGYKGAINDIRIGHDEEFVEKYGATDEVWLSIKQFLALLDWGQENRATLEKLAEEQKSE